MDAISQRGTSAAPDQQLQLGSLSATEMIERGIGFARRQYPAVLFIAACVIALTVVYLWTAPRFYTADATFLIDTTKMQVLQQQQQLVGELPLDAAQVDTQIEVLKSDRIGQAVVKDLKLTENPEFVGSQSGVVGTLIRLIFSPFSSAKADSQPVMSEEALARTALGRYRAHRGVKRVARTYVLDLSYTSRNPGTAASVANAIADAYLVDQLDAKYQASRRASKWLEDRIAELRDQARAADRAVLEFKEKNNIIETRGASATSSSGGQLLVDQRVIDLNAELAKARADVAEAKARLDQIQAVMKEDVPDAAVTDSLNNGVISQLRTQYLDYDRRAHIFASRYGPTHLAVVNLETQKAQLRRSMADELKRIAESYKNNYEIASSREESLEQSLNQQISGAQLTNRELLGLGELESKAKAYHSIHDSFLQRFMEVTQQQSLPISEARVLTAATTGGQSSPNSPKILIIGSVLGLMLGLAVAFFRESIDRVFRTSEQVERLLGTNCLTVLPEVKAPTASTAKKAQVPAANGVHAKELDPPASGLLRHVINEPLSAFAEGLRAVKVAADIARAIKQNTVIGITSSVPGEGKSTVSANFAELVAHSGRKVILIDCDLRNPTLTRKLAPKADVGLLEVLGGTVQLDQAGYRDNLTGLTFLPAVIESRLAHSSEILASDALRQLIDRLRKVYDYVIVDLPPLSPVVDVRATTQIVDSYVFVVEWGRTRMNIVQRQLATTPELSARLLGVVLNKANLKILGRYEDYYGRYYYAKNYYERYGYTQ
jgi:succinoglycan biosynthesis transport protein ExoP